VTTRIHLFARMSAKPETAICADGRTHQSPPSWKFSLAFITRAGFAARQGLVPERFKFRHSFSRCMVRRVGENSASESTLQHQSDQHHKANKLLWNVPLPFGRGSRFVLQTLSDSGFQGCTANPDRLGVSGVCTCKPWVELGSGFVLTNTSWQGTEICRTTPILKTNSKKFELRTRSLRRVRIQSTFHRRRNRFIVPRSCVIAEFSTK